MRLTLLTDYAILSRNDQSTRDLSKMEALEHLNIGGPGFLVWDKHNLSAPSRPARLVGRLLPSLKALQLRSDSLSVEWNTAESPPAAQGCHEERNDTVRMLKNILNSGMIIAQLENSCDMASQGRWGGMGRGDAQAGKGELEAVTAPALQKGIQLTTKINDGSHSGVAQILCGITTVRSGMVSMDS